MKCPLHDRLWNGFRPELDYAVACCYPRQELGAATELVRRGFNVYLPMWTRRSQRREPLWPGYVLVSTNCTTKRPQDVGAISRLVLAAGGAPAIIAGEALAWVREQELGGKLQERAQAINNDPYGVARLPRGTELEALSGPFIGFPCELYSSDGFERCKVLFEIFGRRTAVEMPLADVRAVG